MRWSQTLIPTLRHDPADAEVASHRLMARAGLISKVAAGIYTYLPLGLRSIRKLEAIVREEMERAGSVELSMPAIQPAELWQESGRWTHYGPELLRLRDRHDRDFCFGPTHEEVITHIVRTCTRSYRQLPLCLFQIQTKFRDEIRPRLGLMRGREFLMKDAYSFHADRASLELTYRAMEAAYCRIFERCGLQHVPVEADSGTIGGSESLELMVLADSGEDAVLSCPSCGYAANGEKAGLGSLAAPPAWPLDVNDEPELVSTPDMRSVDEVCKLLGVKPAHLIKTLIFKTDRGEPAVALVRGDREASEIKLRRALGCGQVELADDADIEDLTGAPQGFSGPVGLAPTTHPVRDDVGEQCGAGGEGAEQPRIVADPAVMALTQAVAGANAADCHLVGVVPGRDFEPHTVADITLARPGDPCPRCQAGMDQRRGIEVGHIFKLGTKYSEAMGCTYQDAEGDDHPMVMGCYGLGVGRAVAAAVEQGHDERGIIWPLCLAPYEVLIVLLKAKDNDQVEKVADDLYAELQAAGVDVLLDDRKERPGVKFNDMDLIGFPLRLVVGKKGVASGQVELSTRRDGDKQMVPIGEAVARIQALRVELLP